VNKPSPKTVPVLTLKTPCQKEGGAEGVCVVEGDGIGVVLVVLEDDTGRYVLTPKIMGAAKGKFFYDLGNLLEPNLIQ